MTAWYKKTEEYAKEAVFRNDKLVLWLSYIYRQELVMFSHSDLLTSQDEVKKCKDKLLLFTWK